MNVKEKAGDFILDIAKLIFGGVILAGVMSEEVNKTWLYAIGGVVFTLCCAVAFIIYKVSGKEEK